ncbi:MAG: ABC transporter ATP-binding protein [Proteobacteria bacterium]|nr:ABC transporter ATP-binding protein [Pseudomonadota bacterium]
MRVRHPLIRLAPLFRASRGLLLIGVVGLVAGTALMIAGPWIVAQAIDVDLAQGDRPGLVRKALLYLVLLSAQIAVTYGSRITLEIAAQKAMLQLKEELFDHLVEHDLALHDRHPSGKLITRVQGDTEALRILFVEVILSAPADLLLFLGMFTVMWFTAPEVAWLTFSVIPPYIVLFAIFRKVAPPRFLAVRKVKAQLTGFLTEHLRAMPTLQAFDREAWANERSEELNETVFRAEAISHLHPVWYFNTVVLIRALGIVLLLWVGAGLVAAGSITVGVLVMGLGYLRQMFNPLFRLSHQLASLERARAAAIRIAELLDTPRTIADPEQPEAWPGLVDAVRLEQVGFHYTEGTPVLTDLSLAIPAGSHVGIVGATGAGKSTVLNLLLRFRDPTAGKVTVDGVDLRDIALADLRSRTGLVLQDVHLFAGTVRENLGGGDDAVIAAALATVGVEMPLDHVLLDGAANLSRGERQLLTFARALVRDPELLVLDEATSAVDPRTEARVQAALEKLQEGRTTVTVAHRLATVRGCDRIYVLGRGGIVEQGTHGQLLAAGGLYAALHELQHGEVAA